MAFDWEAAEAKLAAWVSSSTGLQPLWAYQLTEYPDMACVVIDVATMDPADRREQLAAHDGSKPNGEEYQVTTIQHYDVTLNLMAFTSQKNALGSQSPYAVLARAQAYVQQDAVEEDLSSAGLEFMEVGRITKDPELFKNTWRPHAVCEVKFKMAESVVRGYGVINTATVQWTDAPNPALEDMAIETVVP